MEEKEKSLPGGEQKKVEEVETTPNPETSQLTASHQLGEDKKIGIEPHSTQIDEDSSSETKKISVKQLNKKAEEEVKAILQVELATSVKSLKDDLKNEGQEIKKDFLTIFGLFASFVTFLSLEVQVFKNKDNVLELVGITCISLSFVMFFALVINDIAKDKSEWKDFRKPTYIMNSVFAIIGMIFLYIGGTSSINRLDVIEKQSKKDSTEINVLKSTVKQLFTKVEVLDSIIKKQSEIKPSTSVNAADAKKIN
jgi:hypothetical protein